MLSIPHPPSLSKIPCLFGRLPDRPDFVLRGTSSEPERLLQIWITRALELSYSVLPPHAMRFLVAPARTLLAGVWVESLDSLGRVYPLVLVSRVPAAVRALPWELHLASYAGWLDAAESCLMLARRGELERAWRLARALEPPAPAELAALRDEGARALDEEFVRAFAARTFDPAVDGGESFARAIRSFRTCEVSPPHAREPGFDREGFHYDAGSSARVQATGGAAPVFDLPARDELDLFAWLSLVRAQGPAEQAPHAIFWARARRRALIAQGGPDPAMLRPLVQQPKAARLQLIRAATAVECARNQSILHDRSLADLARALAHGLTALPPEAAADMPPPLEEAACYIRTHGVLET